MIAKTPLVIDGIEFSVPKATCNTCGYQWTFARLSKPAYCPKCRSANWNTPKEMAKPNIISRMLRKMSTYTDGQLFSILATKQVLERDNFTCLSCGKQAEYYLGKPVANAVVVHHLDCNHKNNLGINQVTVCYSCHSIVHNEAEVIMEPSC